MFVILDDEKYFIYDGSNMQGNENYYTKDISKCSDSVRFAKKINPPLSQSHDFEFLGLFDTKDLRGG